MLLVKYLFFARTEAIIHGCLGVGQPPRRSYILVPPPLPLHGGTPCGKRNITFRTYIILVKHTKNSLALGMAAGLSMEY